MKLFAASIVIIICYARTSNAQTIVKEGYIVMQNKDTTKGFLEDRIDKEMKYGVVFLKDKSQAPEKYGLDEILEFGTTSRIFRRFNYDFTKYEFGKVANDGTLSLLLFREKNRAKYFIKNNITGNSAVLEHPKKGDDRGGDYKTGSPLFVQKILAVANLSSAKTALKEFPYRENAIRKFVTAYNAKSNPTSARNYKDNIIYHNIIGFGLVKYNGLTSETVHAFSYFFAKENRDRNRKGFLIYGLRYQRFKETKTEPYQGLSYQETTSDIFISPIGYRYSPGLTRVKPYLSVSSGLNLKTAEKFLGYPQLSSERFTTTKLTLSVGAGLSFQIGKRYINLESTFDINNFVQKLSAYRVGVAIDL